MEIRELVNNKSQNPFLYIKTIPNKTYINTEIQIEIENTF